LKIPGGGRVHVPSHFDVIVVGAGPGGSNAAAAAIERGLSVAQIEAQRFPRVKPCAGGVTMKAAHALRGQFATPVRGTFSAAELTVWGEPSNRFHHRSHLLQMVARPEFDNLLVRQNQMKPGFTFFDGEPVTEIGFSDSLFRVTTPERRLTARQLIAADGAYSRVNRRFHIARPRAVAAAIEFALPATSARGMGAAVPCLDFGVVPRGYGWVFPKDDHCSVGLFTFEKGLKDLRRRLIDYATAKDFRVPVTPPPPFEAHQLPVGGYRLTVPAAPVYLVGDAGGFGDALTGEGIYHALESGYLAGRVAAEVARGRATHARYYDDLWLTVLSDTFITYHLARHFYRDPRRGVRLFENPLFWRPFVLGYAEGATVRKILTRGGVYLVRSLFQRLVDRTELPRAMSAVR
jgi:geranylgeranyl reductase family protein